MEVNAKQHIKVELGDKEVLKIVCTKLLATIGIYYKEYDEPHFIDADGNLYRMIDWGDNRGGIEKKIVRVATPDDVAILRAVQLMHIHESRKQSIGI